MLDAAIAPNSNITADFTGLGGADHVDWRVFGQWATRPAEQRYTSFDQMLADMDARTERSMQTDVYLRDIIPHVTSDGEVGLEVNGTVLNPSNFSFAQYCQNIDMPSGIFTKRLANDPDLVVRALRSGLRTCEDPTKKVQVLHTNDEMRGLTSQSYGRIWDSHIVRSIKEATERSGSRWQVPVEFAMPGEVRYSYVPTAEETTLYASDRDVFCFLVDQENPIQAGWRTDAQTGLRVPDMYSRGFYFWNSECGGTSAGCATFLYSWVCANRSIRGQSNFEKIAINHTTFAGQRFVDKLLPALTGFINGDTTGIIDSIMRAKTMKIARTDDDRLGLFANTLDFGPDAAKAIMQKCIDEEGHPVETADDAVQAISAWARTVSYQSDRVMAERKIGKMMKDLALV